MEMLSELKTLVGTNNIYYRNIDGKTEIMDYETRLNKIREIIMNNITRSEMSAELKELLSTDIIIYRNLYEDSKIMDDKTRINKIKNIIMTMNIEDNFHIPILK